MGKLDRLVVTLAGAAVLVGCGSAGREAPVDGEAGADADVITLQPYLPPLTLAEHLAGADDVVVGTVLAVGEPERVTEHTAGAARPFEAVVTRVRVRVDDVVRGGLGTQPEIEVRALGGSAEGLTVHWPGTIDLTQIDVGTRLVVTGGGLGQQDEAITPMLVLGEGPGGFADISGMATDPGPPLLLDDVLALARGTQKS